MHLLVDWTFLSLHSGGVRSIFFPPGKQFFSNCSFLFLSLLWRALIGWLRRTIVIFSCINASASSSAGPFFFFLLLLLCYFHSFLKCASCSLVNSFHLKFAFSSQFHHEWGLWKMMGNLQVNYVAHWKHNKGALFLSQMKKKSLYFIGYNNNRNKASVCHSTPSSISHLFNRYDMFHVLLKHFEQYHINKQRPNGQCFYRIMKRIPWYKLNKKHGWLVSLNA